ncbi:MAG: hypothetical protein R3325_07660 [Thermoanaerobaculia bacterium]|nr:hypothetical protein [Thermoanaerobaculia bacterium]
MVVRIGLGILLFGLLLSAGSCYLLGSAFHEVAQKRRVAVLELTPGEGETAARARAEPGTSARLELQLELVLAEPFVERQRDRWESFSSDLPVNYRVLDGAGREVHLGAGRARCSTRVPPTEAPAHDRFDPRVRCSLKSERFEVPPGGELQVVARVPPADEYGNPVRSASAELYDQLGDPPEARAAGGLLALVAGPAVAGLGFLVALIGWAVRRRARAR